MFSLHPTRIAELLQLVIAPAFLIAAVGTILNVLNARLSRVVDLARDEYDQEEDDPGREPNPARIAFDNHMRELLATRARLLNRSIALSTVSALLVCVLIAALFTDALTTVDLSILIGLMFVGVVSCLAAGLLLFLRDVFVSTAMLRRANFRPGRGSLRRAG